MSKRSRLEAELIRTKIEYTACKEIMAAQKPVIEQQEARIAHLVNIAKQYTQDNKVRCDGLTERTRFLYPEWEAKICDQLAVIFDFKTRRELCTNSSILCQYPDITLVVISHLFRPTPIMYNKLRDAFRPEDESHHNALNSMAALLSTCRYMHYEIGRRHYSNFTEDLLTDTHCSECCSELRKCSHCPRIYCYLCVWIAESCDTCYTNSCSLCITRHGTTIYQTCSRCSQVSCCPCNANVNDHGCDWCQCEVNSDDSDNSTSCDDKWKQSIRINSFVLDSPRLSIPMCHTHSIEMHASGVWQRINQRHETQTRIHFEVYHGRVLRLPCQSGRQNAWGVYQ